MLTRALAPVFAALTTAVLPACDEDRELPLDVEEIEPRDGTQNNPLFNTAKIDTSDIPAVDTQGLEIYGVTLVDVELLTPTGHKSIDPGTLRAVDGTLEARVAGTRLRGTAFLDSRWTFAVDDAHHVAHIEVVETSLAAHLWDPTASDLRMLDPSRLVYTFRWYPDPQYPIDVCATDAVGGSRMVVYEDIAVDHLTGEVSARPNTVYFGCLSGAVGKAALWGYAPDNPTEQSVSLPAFETAMRVIRDDVCADGKSHTADGKAVTLRDSWGINNFPASNIYSTEAIWEVGGGAICTNKLRHTTSLVKLPYVCETHVIPECDDDLTLSSDFSSGAGDFWSRTPILSVL
jgi:ADYC domain